VTAVIPSTAVAAHVADNLGAMRGRLPDATPASNRRVRIMRRKDCMPPEAVRRLRGAVPAAKAMLRRAPRRYCQARDRGASISDVIRVLRQGGQQAIAAQSAAVPAAGA